MDWTSQSAGGDGAHNTMPPFVVLVYIIKYTQTATSDLIFNDGGEPADVARVPSLACQSMPPVGITSMPLRCPSVNCSSGVRWIMPLA